MEEVYCTCGQYLNTYFRMIGQHCFPNGHFKIMGLPCPAKDCPITYTLETSGEVNQDNSLEVKVKICVPS
jgi:hypothetical protein